MAGYLPRPSTNKGVLLRAKGTPPFRRGGVACEKPPPFLEWGCCARGGDREGRADPGSGGREPLYAYMRITRMVPRSVWGGGCRGMFGEWRGDFFSGGGRQLKLFSGILE